MKYNINGTSDFTKEYDYGSGILIRLHTTVIRDLGRGAFVKIHNQTSGKCIVRMARGMSRLNFGRDKIELDYDSRLEIGINGQKDENGFIPCDLVIKKASLFDKIAFCWRHPDFNVRQANTIAMISLFLGLLSILISFIK